jgi:hypothetical protein
LCAIDGNELAPTVRFVISDIDLIDKDMAHGITMPCL